MLAAAGGVERPASACEDEVAAAGGSGDVATAASGGWDDEGADTLGGWKDEGAHAIGGWEDDGTAESGDDASLAVADEAIVMGSVARSQSSDERKTTMKLGNEMIN